MHQPYIFVLLPFHKILIKHYKISYNNTIQRTILFLFLAICFYFTLILPCYFIATQRKLLCLHLIKIFLAYKKKTMLYYIALAPCSFHLPPYISCCTAFATLCTYRCTSYHSQMTSLINFNC